MAVFIGPDEKTLLEGLYQLALSNVIDADNFIKNKKNNNIGKEAFLEIMKLMTVKIPLHYEVTFTFETQKIGLCRHMSMSTSKINSVPSPEAVWMVCECLGFTGELEDCLGIWLEDIGDNRKAVNVLQLVGSEESKALH